MDHDDLIRMLDSGDKNQINKALEIIITQIKGQFFSWSKNKYGLKGFKNEEIEEVLVETIIVFDRKISAGGTKILTSTINAYIFGIAKLKWKEYFRKRKAQSEFQELFDVYFEDPNLEMETENESQLNQQSINWHALSPECQQLLELFYVEGLSYAAILELMPELGNVNNCRQRKHYCVGTLKKKMGL